MHLQDNVWKIICNPAAGRGRSKFNCRIFEQTLQRLGQKYSLEFTTGVGDGITKANIAMEKGYTTILAAGGDGTFNEVLNGILHSPQFDFDRMTFGCVPTGSGNDFTRALGIPNDMTEVASILCQRKLRTIDVGLVEYHERSTLQQRYYLSIAGAGYPAQATRLANMYFKVLGGLCYLAGGVVALIFGPNTSFELDIDGRIVRETYGMLAVANTPFFGSGISIAPRAVPDDGKLDLVLSKKSTRREFARVYFDLLKGVHLDNPLVHFEQISSIEIEAPIGGPLLIDGEVLGRTPAFFKVVPKAIRIMG